MARIQGHHIKYRREGVSNPEWVVDINMLMHRAISRVQITKATPAQYATLINFQHAVTAEANRMRMELDTGMDLRNLKPKPPMRRKKKRGKGMKRGKR
uniref:Uncharacterized protein n=1 Tax=viral metagenome TaxID=1070528 RepID=A0A6M3IMY7_9ZZZZ